MNKRAPLSVCPVTHEAHHWPTELENQGQRQRPLACAYLPPPLSLLTPPSLLCTTIDLEASMCCLLRLLQMLDEALEDTVLHLYYPCL